MLASQAEGALVFRAPLFRVQRGLRVGFASEPPSLKPSQPSKAVLALATGYAYRRAVESGEVADFAALARRLRTSRAWVSMRVELTFLAPRIQEDLVAGTSRSVPIQGLEGIARLKDWKAQLRRWEDLSQG